MDREHLTEQEFDALLDEDQAAEYLTAKTHLAGCAECSTAYKRARRPITILEHLPRHAPSPQFASRVMTKVNVFEPLHVTVLDALKRLAPATPRLQVAMAAGAAMIGLVVSGLLVWVAMRGEALIFIANMGLEQFRIASLGVAQQLALAILGEPTFAALGLQGSAVIWFTLGLLTTSIVVSALGLRLVASAARRGGN